MLCLIFSCIFSVHSFIHIFLFKFFSFFLKRKTKNLLEFNAKSKSSHKKEHATFFKGKEPNKETDRILAKRHKQSNRNLMSPFEFIYGFNYLSFAKATTNNGWKRFKKKKELTRSISCLSKFLNPLRKLSNLKLT